MHSTESERALDRWADLFEGLLGAQIPLCEIKAWSIIQRTSIAKGQNLLELLMRKELDL
jgi:hypothetical protein